MALQRLLRPQGVEHRSKIFGSIIASISCGPSISLSCTIGTINGRQPLYRVVVKNCYVMDLLMVEGCPEA